MTTRQTTITIIAGVALIALGTIAGYYSGLVNRSAPISPSPEVTPPEATNPLTQISDVAWQAPELSTDLDRIFSAIPLGDRILVPESIKAYKVGTVTDGRYKDGVLYIALAREDGPVLYPNIYRILKGPSGEFTLLTKYSSSLDSPILLTNHDISVPALDAPEIIQTEDMLSPEPFLRDPWPVALFDPSKVKVAFTHPIYGNIYTTDPNAEQVPPFSSNGFFLRLADGTTATYKWDNRLLNGEFKATWTNGTEENVSYAFASVGGCGATNYVNVISRGPSENAGYMSLHGIAPIGSAGVTLYGYQDPNNQELKDYYENGYFVPSDEPKASYEEFVASHPIIFFVDPFERLIRGTASKFLPAVECGKPVIYLYPTKRMVVDVKLNPAGGFTKSEPAYGNGWRVTADPNGTLKTSDGATYPYLFWEGRGGMYETPKNGFVVKQSEVHSFLTKNLGKLGLNSKEISDFQEFWEPRMTGAPYYFVTFLGNREMNRLAPLSISPTPDSVIRILMDYKPLTAPIDAKPFKIKTPARTGFTVVEWGGVLR